MVEELSASIIIPCKKIDEYVEECVKHCLSLSYANLGVLVLPDREQHLSYNDSRVRVIPTGVAKPSHKRNVGIKCSKSEICAFIDADAYPHKDWLKNVVKYFKDAEVAAVGGPSLTPASDNIWQKASGLILASRLGGGKFTHRYTSRKTKDDDDLPACNLVLRKSVLDKLGGFNVDNWPGEDTYLSMQITKQLNMKMVYAPDVVVFHHRRSLFREHLKQIWAYGLHRGYFAKKYPENSRKPIYFIPSLLVFGIITGLPLAFLNTVLMVVYLSLLAAYFTACLFEGIKTKNLKTAFFVSIGIPLTHITYGIAFLRGLAIKNLKD